MITTMDQAVQVQLRRICAGRYGYAKAVHRFRRRELRKMSFNVEHQLWNQLPVCLPNRLGDAHDA
ncbi:MAG: hypothetical protein AAGI11_15160 [Pseudomonadota bacterium]